VATAVVGAAGCGTTVDPRSGENLIRTVAATNGLGRVDTVSCPSGLPPKTGTAFDCRVKLTDAGGRSRAGTITVHIVAGRKVAILGEGDLHLR
jgi:hypothetical protein